MKKKFFLDLPVHLLSQLFYYFLCVCLCRYSHTHTPSLCLKHLRLRRLLNISGCASAENEAILLHKSQYSYYRKLSINICNLIYCPQHFSLKICLFLFLKWGKMEGTIDGFNHS